MKIQYLFSCLLIALMLGATSCESDSVVTPIDNSDNGKELLDKAKTILDGPIVFSTRATMASVDKTLLPTGCPTKFNFSWKEEEQALFVELKDFTVGGMPLCITFRCDTKFYTLNSWEKKEYPGKGWIKFSGSDGYVMAVPTGYSIDEFFDHLEDAQQGSGSRIDGYLNTETNQIKFIVDYNMYLVRSETFLQTIDKSRLAKYDEEFAQYEKDLAEYKKEHGLN